MEAFAQEQKRHGEVLAQNLAATLSTMLLPTSSTEPSSSPPSSSLSWQTLHKQIIFPAIHLANAIRTATTDYQFPSHLFARSKSSPHAVYRNEIGSYQMLDCATQKVIRMDSQLKVDAEGRIGEVMWVVSPGFVRFAPPRGAGEVSGGGGRRDEEGEPRAVEKAVMIKPSILVRLDEPMGRKKPQIKPPGFFSLGWLAGGGGGGGGGSSQQSLQQQQHAGVEKEGSDVGDEQEGRAGEGERG